MYIIYNILYIKLIREATESVQPDRELDVQHEVVSLL